MPSGYIYILHFSDKLHHAEHYCGCTCHLQMRLTTHAFGHGSRLCRALMEKGIQWQLAAIGQCCRAEMRRIERTLKDQHNAKRFCTICSSPAGRIAGTTPYPLGNIPFPIDSESIRRCGQSTYYVGQDVEVRLTTSDEPIRTAKFILDTMKVEKDALGFIPVNTRGGGEGIRYSIDKQLVCLVTVNTQPVGYSAFTCDHEAKKLNIHQCVVIDQARLLGFGAAMVNFLREKFHYHTICAKVRDDLAANEFWLAMGFTRLWTKTHKTSGRSIHQYFREPMFPGN